MFIFFELPEDERHLVQVEVDRVPGPGELVAVPSADEVHTNAVEQITTAVIGNHESRRGVILVGLRHLPDKLHDKSWLSRITPFPN